MKFLLVSQQFVFDGGDATVLQHADGARPHLSDGAKVHANRVDDLGAVAGDSSLLIHDCRVTSLATRVVRRIPSLTLPVHVTEAALAEGHTAVVIGFHAFVRIEVVDDAGRPVRSRVVVGVALDTSTIEAPASDEGYLDVLVRPGSHCAYVLGRPDVPTFFSVEDGREEGGTVRLTV